MGLAIQVKGLYELDRGFKAMGEKAQLVAVRKALKDGAQIILEEARVRSSVSPHILTGRLRSSFRSYATPYYAKITNNAFQPITGGYYAAVHEYGGTIYPRGTPIVIRKSAMIWGAL